MLTKPHRLAVVVLLIFGLASAAVLSIQPGVAAASREAHDLIVEYGGETPVAVTPDLWAKLPRTQIKVPAADGAEATYEGVAMAELLKLVKAPLGKELRGRMLAKYVLVEAADDHRVVLALAEVDPEWSTQEVIVADRRDGKPLAAQEGPYRVILSAEKKRGRWVRQITRISVKSAEEDGAEAQR